MLVYSYIHRLGLSNTCCQSSEKSSLEGIFRRSLAALFDLGRNPLLSRPEGSYGLMGKVFCGKRIRSER